MPGLCIPTPFSYIRGGDRWAGRASDGFFPLAQKVFGGNHTGGASPEVGISWVVFPWASVSGPRAGPTRFGEEVTGWMAPALGEPRTPSSSSVPTYAPLLHLALRYRENTISCRCEGGCARPGHPSKIYNGLIQRFIPEQEDS